MLKPSRSAKLLFLLNIAAPIGAALAQQDLPVAPSALPEKPIPACMPDSRLFNPQPNCPQMQMHFFLLRGISIPAPAPKTFSFDPIKDPVAPPIAVQLQNQIGGKYPKTARAIRHSPVTFRPHFGHHR